MTFGIAIALKTGVNLITLLNGVYRMEDNFIIDDDNNKLSNKQVIDRFIKNEIFNTFKQGWPFLRALNLF